MSSSRVLISGIESENYRSVITLALLLALKKRGVSVACAINGPRLGLATLLYRTSKRYVRILDSKILTKENITDSISLLSQGSDIVLIDGTKTTFQGRKPDSLKGSDYNLAESTKTSLVGILSEVIPPHAMILFSLGFSEQLKSMTNSAIIAVESVSTKETYKEASIRFKNRSLIGVVPKLDLKEGLTFNSFLNEESPLFLDHKFLQELATVAEENINIDYLLEIAKLSQQSENFERYQPINKRTRIAISEDLAFSRVIQDNLEWLKFFGAELVPFSPLTDTELPKKIGAVYLTDVYLADYGKEISENVNMKKSLRDYAENGGVVYSEGSSTAYLHNEFQLPNSSDYLTGVGLISGEALWIEGSTAYSDILMVDDTILGNQGQIVRGISPRRWLSQSQNNLLKTMKISVDKQQPESEGFSPGAQILSTFNLLHFGSSPLMAKSIVDSAEVYYSHNTTSRTKPELD